MSEIRAGIVLNLAGNLQARSQSFTQAIQRFSASGRRSLGALNSAAVLAGQAIDKMGNRYTALLTGGGLTMAAKQVGNLQQRITYLGIQSNQTDAQMQRLKQTVFDTANAPDIRVDPAQILDAIDAIVEKTGDIEFAQKNIRNIGLAIRATGAEGGAIGELLGEFQKMGIKAPAEVMRSIDTLNIQGKEGAFTLQNLAALGPRVITAYTALGRTGTGALTEMGAALQMIRMGTGSSEMAATAFEATLRTLGDPQKLQALQKAGIRVFDVKDGKKQIRAINEIMAEIIKATNGDTTRIGAIFDAEAVRAFNAASSEFNRTGQLATLEKFSKMQGDGAQTTRDAARASQTFNASLQSLTNSAQKFADQNLAGPIAKVADVIGTLDPDQVQRYFKVATYGALAFGAALAHIKLTKMIGGLRQMGQGNPLQQAAGATSGMQPIPVIVVGGSGLPGTPGAGGGTSQPTTRAAKIANGLAKGGMVAEAGMAGYAVGSAIYSAFDDTRAMDMLGAGIAHAMTSLGSTTARESIAARKAAEGSLKIEVEDNRIRVRQVQATGFDMDVTGMNMAAGMM
jgi:hypothetical protein